MNNLMAILLVAVSFANAVLVQEQSSIHPGSVYKDGVTVVSPNQPGWVLLQSSKSETVFEKRVKDDIVTANVKTFKTKIFDSDKDLLISLEALKKEELSKLNRDSIHFNYVRFKNTPCLQYDGIFKVDGESSTKLQYFNLKGYLCRHPEAKDLVVQMEFSNYANLRGLSENLSSLSDEFFERIVFQSSQVVQRPGHASKDEQELRRLEDEWLGSYLRGDKATFDLIVADDFTGTDESAKVRNKAQERELIQASPSSLKASLTNEDLLVRIYGDTAVVVGRIVFKAQPGGQTEIGFQSRFTDTLLKRKERWQVVARHYSRLPPERVPIKLDPKIYDAYIGQYELAPSVVLSVTRDGDRLITQATGQPKFDLLPESEIAFFIKDISALFVFMRDEKGGVSKLITIQDGRIISAKRIK